MKRLIVLGLLATAAFSFAAGCAKNGFATVAITKNASTVASCTAMGEVKASSLTPDEDVKRDLTEAVRSKGANTLLIASDNARTGTAYQCAMPEATAQAKPTSGR